MTGSSQCSWRSSCHGERGGPAEVLATLARNLPCTKKGGPRTALPRNRLEAISLLLQPFEQGARNVPLRERARDRDDALAFHLRPGGDFEGDRDVRAGGDAARDALKLGELARGIEGGLVADRDHLVDDRAVQDVGNEAGADALNLVRSGLSDRQHR